MKPGKVRRLGCGLAECGASAVRRDVPSRQSGCVT